MFPRDGAGMIKRKSQILILWFFVWDLSLTSCSWVGAYFLRFKSGMFEVVKETPPLSLCLNNLPLVLLICRRLSLDGAVRHPPFPPPA